MQYSSVLMMSGHRSVYQNSVVAHLRMDGADAATVFTDEKGKVWTARGNAQIDIAQSKFGGASGLFDGTGDWIDTPDHADFSLGTNKLTAMFWLRLAALTASARFCGQIDSGGTNASLSIALGLDATASKLRALAASGAALICDITGAGAIGADTWYFVKLVRDGSDFVLRLNGVSDGTDSDAGAINNSTRTFSIGRVGELNSNFTNGWIDDFVLLNGAALNDADVPTIPFPKF